MNSPASEPTRWPSGSWSSSPSPTSTRLSPNAWALAGLLCLAEEELASLRPYEMAEWIVEHLAAHGIYLFTAERLGRVLAALDPGKTQAHAGPERIVELLAAPDIDRDTAETLGRAFAVLTPANPRPHEVAERIVERLAVPGTNLFGAATLVEALGRLRDVMSLEEWMAVLECRGSPQ
jgi:hypothetical protein